MYLFMTYVCFFSIPETSSLTIVDGCGMAIIAVGNGCSCARRCGLIPRRSNSRYCKYWALRNNWSNLAVLIHSAQSIMILTTGIIAALVRLSLKEIFKMNQQKHLSKLYQRKNSAWFVNGGIQKKLFLQMAVSTCFTWAC